MGFKRLSKFLIAFCFCCVLLSIEPVEIFHQLLFFAFVKFKNIPFGEFIGIIFNCFVHTSRFHAIQYSNITIEYYLLVTNGQNFTFNLIEFYDFAKNTTKTKALLNNLQFTIYNL